MKWVGGVDGLKNINNKLFVLFGEYFGEKGNMKYLCKLLITSEAGGLLFPEGALRTCLKKPSFPAFNEETEKHSCFVAACCRARVGGAGRFPIFQSPVQ